MPPAQPQMNQAVRIVNAVDPGVTTTTCSRLPEKVIVNIIGRNARAIRALRRLVNQWHLFIDGFDHYDRRPWTALAIRGWRGRLRICRRRPRRAHQWPSPVLPCAAFTEGSGGGCVKNLDTTKTSLIVGGSHSRGAVPEHLHRATATGRAMPTRGSRTS